jgi:hypothetical protein
MLELSFRLVLVNYYLLYTVFLPLHIPDPLSTTRAATSSSSSDMLLVVVCNEGDACKQFLFYVNEDDFVADFGSPPMTRGTFMSGKRGCGVSARFSKWRCLLDVASTQLLYHEPERVICPWFELGLS